jgi:hypothetical protein
MNRAKWLITVLFSLLCKLYREKKRPLNCNPRLHLSSYSRYSILINLHITGIGGGLMDLSNAGWLHSFRSAAAAPMLGGLMVRC